jgi:carbamoyl-phosphate synthase small subunit
MNSKKATLVLEDGTELQGYSFGYEKSSAGEVVFNTSMTGYIESLTDPSYTGQILTLTYPLIGNYGVPSTIDESAIPKYFESNKIHIKGLIISNYSFRYHHWSAAKSLSEWLKENKVPGLFGIDTRELTKKIRDHGTILGKIIFDDDIDFFDPDKYDLVKEVSVKEKREFGNGKYRILLVDCGAKNNILRCLLNRDTTVIQVPYNAEIKNESYDGIVISNGPGDPKMCTSTIKNVTKVLEDNKPIFGICMGNQILTLAAGGDTYKLKFGHRSHNQPVIKPNTNRAYITSQNHGFAVDNNSLGDDWEPYFINLNDNTNEGIKHRDKPFFSTQFHPEASSGPTDTEFLFDEFLDIVKEHAK